MRRGRYLRRDFVSGQVGDGRRAVGREGQAAVVHDGADVVRGAQRVDLAGGELVEVVEKTWVCEVRALRRVTVRQ